jgi:hypothetical protein
MAGNPHKRTDDLFDKLIAETKDKGTKAILQGLHWLCIVTEEVGIGVQMHTGELNDSLTVISDKLDRLKR